MKVIQILPELNSGGVERGTLEVASHLVKKGHESIVISNGGRLVVDLVNQGSRHLQLPVHRKAPASLMQVIKLREIFQEEKPDLIHLRSRVPAWLAWLAWKSMDPRTRPRMVTTVHGFYSVNPYSAIMVRGEKVIAVSQSIFNYVLKNYPGTDPAKLRVIHRGVDESNYFPTFSASSAWQAEWKRTYPTLTGRILLTLPARVTRWKGQEDFIRIIARLKSAGHPVHGLIVGETHVKKFAFLQQLQQLAAQLGVSDFVSFPGHRSDLREIMSISAVVYSLSTDPEAFGRVSLEALALGRPVIAYNHGGVAEQLNAIFPEGLIEVGDLDAATAKTLQILGSHDAPLPIGSFTLRRMLDATLDVYREVTKTKSN